MEYKKIMLSTFIFIPLIILTPIDIRKKVGGFFTGAKETAKEKVSDSKDILKKTIKSPTLKMIDAANEGKYKTVKALLTLGVNVNGADMYKNTALMAAAQNGDDKMVILLLDAGADVNATNIEGNTALMRAAREGYPEIVSHLLKAGAKKNMRDDKEHTALYYALIMQKGHPEKEEYKQIIELLS